MPTHDEIEAAARRLQPFLRHTPVLELAPGDILPGVPAVLKLEFLQHSGSFKARGAFNKLLTSDVTETGVAAASGGNHGAAVAYAARALGHAATIFVPAPTPAAKLDRIAAYGARIVQGGAAYADALEACRAFQAQTGALDVHAYDEPAVLAGQGTLAAEMAASAPGLTHVLVAVGGGGLIGGVASWYRGTGTVVVGVEPQNCPTWHDARRNGGPLPVSVSGIASDSLGAGVLGGLSYRVLSETGAQSVLVDDDAIRAAQAWLWDRLRIVSEPGGAVALAPLLNGAWVPPAGARVGVVLCGANTDPGSVSRETT